MGEDELAFQLWCFLAGKGSKVHEFRNEFQDGIPVTAEPADLRAMVREFDLTSADKKEPET